MTRGGKTFVSIFFQSSTIPGLLHAAERWIKVEEQGPPDQLWEDAAPAKVAAAAVYIDERGEDIADFDDVDVLLHEIARLLLETGGKDGQLFGGQGERHAIVHLQPVHVASALFGNNIGFVVYHPTTAIVPRQVLADS